MTSQTGIICAIALNCAIVIMETIALCMTIKKDGAGLFKYYTDDSNLFALVTGIIFLITAIQAVVTRSFMVPAWVRVLRLMTTAMLMVTFIVVITVLAPSRNPGGYRKMLLKAQMKYVHLLCPLVSFVSFVLFEGAPALAPGTSLVAMIPTVIYAVIAISMNITRKLDGPYPFLRVHEQPVYMSIIWTVVIIGGAWAAGLGIWRLSDLLAG